jgi:DNA-binding transcriptional regulator GbsR (MarR family)
MDSRPREVAPGEPTFEQQVAGFVEEFAIVMEGRGLPRMAGRVFARLLVCEPPEQSADQLADALHASRGTVSDMTRLLIEAGLIQRVGRPGERRIYYVVAPDTPTRFLRASIEPLRVRLRVTEHGLEILRDRTPEVRRRLQELRDVYAFSEQVYPEILERWLRERHGGAG